ncbi:MAG: host attachment protein [Caulobacteraceae bacterium]
MQLPNGATVAVADGEKLNLFRNIGDEGHPKLTALPAGEVDTGRRGSGGGHHSSSANPGQSQVVEDGFSAGVADLLNREVLTGKIAQLVIIAPPRALGELRKHYHQKLSAVLIGEIPKDLTGHTIGDVESAIAAA